jgi:hypothetical protein
VKEFYKNRDLCDVLTGYLSMGRRSGGDWANTMGRRPGGDWANMCNCRKIVQFYFQKTIGRELIVMFPWQNFLLLFQAIILFDGEMLVSDDVF